MLDGSVSIFSAQDYAIVGVGSANEYVTWRIAKRPWGANDHGVKEHDGTKQQQGNVSVEHNASSTFLNARQRLKIEDASYNIYSNLLRL
jgi:hypothetical protein